jgi:hypothetical protein
MGQRLRPYGLAIALFVAGLAVVGLGAILGFASDNEPQPHFGLELAKGALTLGSGLILGGAVKVLLDRYQQALKERQDEHELRERLLGDLRNVHDRTESTRLMVNAHRSAQIYGDQMGDLIGCQVTLLKIKRSLDLRLGSNRRVDPEAVCLETMISYLRALQHEYETNYWSLADCARYDEAVTRHRLDELAAANTPFDPQAAEASHRAWKLMSDPAKFPVLHDLTHCGERYMKNFRQPLNDLAAQLLNTESPPVDIQSEVRVSALAHDIESMCSAARLPIQTQANQGTTNR